MDNRTDVGQGSQVREQPSLLQRLDLLQKQCWEDSFGAEESVPKKIARCVAWRIPGPRSSWAAIAAWAGETKRGADQDGERSRNETERNPRKHSQERGGATNNSARNRSERPILKHHHPESGSGRLQLYEECVQHLHWQHPGKSEVRKRNDMVMEVRNCGHLYHLEELEQWLLRGNRTCPNCGGVNIVSAEEVRQLRYRQNEWDQKVD